MGIFVTVRDMNLFRLSGYEEGDVFHWRRFMRQGKEKSNIFEKVAMWKTGTPADHNVSDGKWKTACLLVTSK